MDKRTQTESEFNDAIGFTRRLDYQFWKINQGREHDYSLREMICAINTLYHELVPFIEGTKREDLLLRIRALESKVYVNHAIKVTPQIVSEIEQVEDDLRDIHFSASLLTKTKNDFLGADDW